MLTVQEKREEVDASEERSGKKKRLRKERVLIRAHRLETNILEFVSSLAARCSVLSSCEPFLFFWDSHFSSRLDLVLLSCGLFAICSSFDLILKKKQQQPTHCSMLAYRYIVHTASPFLFFVPDR